ncbi:MAG TPA: MFS transporter [Streptosporangiaceae bacterium]|jgi:MFS family permease|nr:MFS transporter [Streptosporangiaceae bacterium]
MGLSEARRVSGQAAHATGSAARSAARAGASATRWTGRFVHRLSSASGAGRTGLSSLIELTAAGSAGDAFVAVALAGTVFFNTSLHEARSQVVLYLVLTMTPFALLAPFIGPMLDRIRQGRRYIMMGSLLARGLLCWAMSGAIHDPVTLFPAAFGVLILQKAYLITRSSVTPRLLPAEITLVTANARNGLGAVLASSAAAPVAAGIVAVAGAPWALRIGTLVYLVATVLGARVPGHVDAPAAPAAPLAQQDSGSGAPSAPAGPGTPGEPPAPRGTGARTGHPDAALPLEGGFAGPARPAAATRRRRWLRSIGPIVAEAMWADAALRAFAGFMVFFLAFLLRSDHFHGFSQNVALGALVLAAAVGGLIGTAAGSVFRSRMPHLMVFGVLAVSIATCVVCALYFGLGTALIVAFVASVGTVLAKLALDSTVQREVPEETRTSAFAVSETVHQVSWVAGGLAGVLVSMTDSGPVGLGISAAGIAAALLLLLSARRRRLPGVASRAAA